MSVKIYTGDALSVLRTLEPESVQLVVTSPPYAFLRSYLPADHPDKAKEIGSEPAPEAFVAALVEVFREVRRVLRHDGVAIVNLGDSYSGSGKGTPGPNALIKHTERQGFVGAGSEARNGSSPQIKTGQTYGLPPKSLLEIPSRVALALQADGWILRSRLPWIKRSSMPESVQDRPASAIEYLFLFARSPRYFWDAEAIRVPHADFREGHNTTRPQDQNGVRKWNPKDNQYNPAGRSYRNSDPFMATWQGLMLDEAGDPLALVVNPQPSSLQHFASYPPALVEPFVKAGTSQRGCCPACRAPWVRVVERKGVRDLIADKALSGGKNADILASGQRNHALSFSNSHDLPQSPQVTTLGWRPGCACDAGEPVPCVVLDPFLGSGTTAMVADRLQRDAIGIELSPEYVRLAEQRLRGDAGPLFADIEVAG